MSYAGRKGASTSRLRTGSQPPSSLNLKRQLIAQIVQSSLLLREYMDHCAKVHGTTRAQWTVLIQLRQQEGRSQADLADILGLQPISLVRLLDRIMQHELLERRADHMDRRINRLYLTSKGRTLVDDLDGESLWRWAQLSDVVSNVGERGLRTLDILWPHLPMPNSKNADVIPARI